VAALLPPEDGVLPEDEVDSFFAAAGDGEDEEDESDDDEPEDEDSPAVAFGRLSVR
jgi:hypothetical protein